MHHFKNISDEIPSFINEETLNKQNTEYLNQRFEELTPYDIINWAIGFFDKGIMATSSFQSQSVPLLHIISEADNNLPILFLDTGFHFEETLEFRDRLTKDLNLNVINVTNHLGHKGFKDKYGNLYQKDPDMCCYLNKVQPLKKHLKKYNAWITGIRRDQTENREKQEFIQYDDENDIYKISPMLNWTRHDIWTYLSRNNLPEHPLLAKGYLSIGCAPCTRPPIDGDERSGRWSGNNKSECGLHTELGGNNK